MGVFLEADADCQGADGAGAGAGAQRNIHAILAVTSTSQTLPNHHESDANVGSIVRKGADEVTLQ
jgi:hypothetical protein